jgi:acyl-CoA thioesterase FadM
LDIALAHRVTNKRKVFCLASTKAVFVSADLEHDVRFPKEDRPAKGDGHTEGEEFGRGES